MTKRVFLLVGTRKGAFVLEGDERRERWEVRGPFCEGWTIKHVTWDPAARAIVACGANPWYGAAVWRSPDLGATWSQSSAGLTYGEEGPPLTDVWTVAAAHGELYAGVEPAGLFRSRDGGATWEHVAGLREHPSRPTWQPSNGGLCLHTVLVHPADPRRIWVAISAAGVFASEDGGATWEARNRGVRADFMPDPYPETGQCVHKMALAGGQPERLYQQNHCGTYRSDDAGRTWLSLEAGLPSSFGFPVVTHPRDPDTAWCIVLAGEARLVPEAAMVVWETRDAGATWRDRREGLPQQGGHLSVLRDALAADTLEPLGLYLGTSTGLLFTSADEGATWRPVPGYLPGIASVEAVVLEEPGP